MQPPACSVAVAWGRQTEEKEKYSVVLPAAGGGSSGGEEGKCARRRPGLSPQVHSLAASSTFTFNDITGKNGDGRMGVAGR